MLKAKALLLSFCILFPCNSYAQKPCLVTKYIFDIGSGGIKSTGYLVDQCKGTISKALNKHYDNSFSLQECISSSPDGQTISKLCLKKARQTITSIKNKLDINCSQQQCSGIATAWARTAKDPAALINEIKSQGIDVSVLNQYDEGKLSFLSLAANNMVPKEKVMVFDLGGGSFQLSGEDKNGDIKVYNGPYGMFNLKPLIISKFGTGKNDILPADSLEEIKEFTIMKIGSGIKNATYLKGKDKVFATGAFMNRGVKKQLELGDNVSLKQIEEVIHNIVGKTTDEIRTIYPKLPAEHAINAQFSLLIIHAVMKEAKIENITIIPNNQINEYLALHDNI